MHCFLCSVFWWDLTYFIITFGEHFILKVSCDAVCSAEFLNLLIFVQLISGIQLPPSYQNKADTLVIVEIFGVPNDQMKQQSRVIKKNGEPLIYFIDQSIRFHVGKLKNCVLIEFWYIFIFHKAKLLHYVQDDQSIICGKNNLIMT